MDRPRTIGTVATMSVFKGRWVRRALPEGEWWFSVVDVVGALTDSPDAGAYWRKLKQRLNEEGSEVVTFCHGLKLESSDGKKYETDCADAEGIFRIVQSIPSPKAEPFKRWLAKVGVGRVKEIENLEFASQQVQARRRCRRNHRRKRPQDPGEAVEMTDCLQ